jgi:4-hydroxy-4-methyl-2-oxoglutarate aldolase
VSAAFAQLARLGSATVYEASGREGLVDLDLRPLLLGVHAAGPARTVRCGQGDNLMVHAVMDSAQPGDVLVLTMPEPEPVALIGELLATQAKARGVVALLVDAAVRDVEDLRELGLPIWARWVRVRGADKNAVGELDVPVDVGGLPIWTRWIRVKGAQKTVAGAIDEPVEVGGTTIHPGDAVVLDVDGVVVVRRERVDEVLAAARERAEYERAKRAQLETGALSYDLDRLRERVEGE